MKNSITYSFNFIRKNIVLIALLIGASFYLISQSNDLKYGADRDVIPGYKGWAGDPDSVTIHIDTTFTEAEKDSVRTAISRWNEAGSIPKLKEVSSPPANISVTESTTLPDTVAGLCTINTNTDGDVTSSTIQINDDTSPLSLKEVATHEIGHALGLDDTHGAANASDVMKGEGPTNGTDGGLSAHDSTELAAAGTAALAVEVDDKVALNPMAIMPGEFAVLDFDLGEVFPPDVIDQTDVFVSPIGDPYLFVESAFIEANLLRVGVFSEPMHGSGKLYLNVELLFPAPYPVMHFRGVHCIHIMPVEPLTFECPFSFNEDDGLVHIDWVENCTYPYNSQLRSELVVDGSAHYFQRGGGDYVLELEPGTYMVELYVDDYQVNSAYYSMDILVTGVPEEKESTAVKAYPNPFSQVCLFECPENSQITIYDISGSLIADLGSYNKQWKPSPDLPEGIYFIRFKDKTQIKTIKVIYRK